MEVNTKCSGWIRGEWPPRHAASQGFVQCRRCRERLFLFPLKSAKNHSAEAATGFRHRVPHKLARKRDSMTRKRKHRRAIVEIGTDPAKAWIDTINRKDGYDK